MVYFVVQNVKTDGNWDTDCRDFAIEIDITKDNFEDFLEKDESQSEYDFRTEVSEFLELHKDINGVVEGGICESNPKTGSVFDLPSKKTGSFFDGIVLRTDELLSDKTIKKVSKKIVKIYREHCKNLCVKPGITTLCFGTFVPGENIFRSSDFCLLP